MEGLGRGGEAGSPSVFRKQPKWTEPHPPHSGSANQRCTAEPLKGGERGWGIPVEIMKTPV